MDHRILLGFPNRLDGAGLSGGSWRASLPLANLQNRLLARVARSTNAQASSTTFTLDFGRPRPLRALALIAHNCSLTARVRYTISNAADLSAPVYDVTTDVWGSAVNGTWNIDELEWENDNFWLGTYDTEEIEGLTPVSVHVMPEEAVGRYLRISILDDVNAAGYVEIGRVFAGACLSPRVNYAWGANFGFDVATEVQTALGGAEFYDPREPVRLFRFTLQHMQGDEAYGTFLEMMRRAGLHGEILVIPDPDDVENGIRRNFVGRIRTPSILETVQWENGGSAHAMSFEIKELR